MPSFLYFLCVWDALKPKPEIKRQLPTPLKYRLKKTSPVKITLNEVAHSVFYAPLYVAIEKGYFKDENIDLTLVTGFGADKTMTAVISGEAILDLWDLKLPFICTAKELPTMSLILHSSHSEPETFSLHGKTTSIFSGRSQRKNCSGR